LRGIVLLALALLPTLARGATPAGRWEGVVDVPGRPLPLVVDLAPGTGGGWIGSIIVPGIGIKGAALVHVNVEAGSVGFDLGSVLASPAEGPATFSAHVDADGAMHGEMRQAGNVARFTMTRTGSPQVEAPPRSTPVALEIARTWRGDFEWGGYPRHVTLGFENHGNAGATATLVVVGKMTTSVPIDLVLQEGANVRVESQAMGIAFEGRLDAAGGELQGTIEIGSIERPLVLHAGGAR
jgi:hypothetical protein